LILIIAATLAGLTSCASAEEQAYQDGKKAMENHAYSIAALEFEGILDYKDSAELYLEASYQAGLSNLDNQRYLYALEAFRDAGEYKDAGTLASRSAYEAFNYYLKNSSDTPTIGFDEMVDAMNDADQVKASTLYYDYYSTADVHPYSWRQWRADATGVGSQAAYQSMDDQGKLNKANVVARSLLAYLNGGVTTYFDEYDNDRSAEDTLEDAEALLGMSPLPAQAESVASLYDAAVDTMGKVENWVYDPGSFYDPKVGFRFYSGLWHMLGDYKDSADWRRRAENATVLPVVLEDSYRAQASNAGTQAQPRTVLFVSPTGPDDFAATGLGAQTVEKLKAQAESGVVHYLNQYLKALSLGDIYYTDDPSRAGIVIVVTSRSLSQGAYNYVDAEGKASSVRYTDTEIHVLATDAQSGRVVFDETQTAAVGDPDQMLPADASSIAGYLTSDAKMAMAQRLYAAISASL
jgi:hypothetical protein